MRTAVGVLLMLAAGGGTVHADDYNALLKGRAAAAALGETLDGRLAKSLKDSGPAGAMSVCAYQAQALADESGKAEGVTVRRTSLKLRNPANAPDTFEKEMLVRFAADASAGVLPEETLEQRWDNGRKIYRYAKPLLVAQMCISCHGRPEDISEDARKFLETRSPEDAATGYRPGELRGSVSVVIPAE